MKSLYFEKYGTSEVLSFREIPQPELESGRVLVRVHAAAVNPLDWRLMRADPFLVRMELGLFKPKSHGLGADFSGVVERVADDVSRFEPGDAVFGLTFPKGFCSFAEYVSVSAEAPARKPESLSHQQASTLGIAALTAYQGIYDYRDIAPGDCVLVNGASGGVGTFAVQMAKARGAHVTAVCSARNHGLVCSLGADSVIDYQAEDLTRISERYDLIFDAIGPHAPKKMKRLLRQGGKLVFASAGNAWGFLRVIVAAKRDKSIELIFELEKSAARLQALLDLHAEGKLMPAIDREYPFDEVKTAIDYVATHRARGKVVVNITQPD